ncbi:MAG: hypothetical protein ACFB10_21760 [Salibacteraceae bacterium]
MKSIVLLSFSLLFSVGLMAQAWEVPSYIKLEEAADYAKYENDVIKCINWLQVTPLGQQNDKRKAANAFFMLWITGSPNVTIELQGDMVPFMKSSPEMLTVFMGGWTKYALENKDFDNKVMGNMAGIEAVIDFYERNRNHFKKDKKIEKFIKMKADGKLKSFIEERV